MSGNDTPQLDSCSPEDTGAGGVVLNVKSHSYDADTQTAVGKLSTYDVTVTSGRLLEIPSENHVTFRFGEDTKLPACGCPEIKTTAADVSIEMADWGLSVEVTTKNVSPEMAEKTELAQCFNIQAGVIQEKIASNQPAEPVHGHSPGMGMDP